MNHAFLGETLPLAQDNNDTPRRAVFLCLRLLCIFFAVFALFSGMALWLNAQQGTVFSAQTAMPLLFAQETGNIALFCIILLLLAAAFGSVLRKLQNRCRLLRQENANLAAALAETDKQDSPLLSESVAATCPDSDNNYKNIFRNTAQSAEADILLSALNAVKMPLWLCDKTGKPLFANNACDTVAAAQNIGIEEQAETNPQIHTDTPAMEQLFSPSMQQALQTARRQGQNFTGNGNIILSGNRHIFYCQSFPCKNGEFFINMAEDRTEQQQMREEISNIRQGYADVFDCLSTAVAIFSPTQKLEFCNSAFAQLWPLEPAFLEEKPYHAVVLDRLREKGILNERPDWRQWKNELFEAYHALNPQHYIWNLPNGRTLRVIANPHPQGGVAWLFDDLTEKMALQTRYNSLIKMQGETLDSLSEGVAVFGADGKLRLANPAFAKLWHLPADLAVEKVHIEKIKGFCRQVLRMKNADVSPQFPTDNTAPAELDNGENIWDKIARFVTGIADARDYVQGRTELWPRQTETEKRIIAYMLIPLPQRQTMITFVDVTDSAHIARALHERNAALEEADNLRNDFVRHVSYELRTPLTSIIGFTDLLLSSAFGVLNSKQHGCLQDIAAQSALLLQLVNDILDLATVDAGVMELNIGSVAIDEAMSCAADRLKDRMAEKNITLTLERAEELTHFNGDAARVRQIFINLLSNAVHAAPKNSRIRFSAEKYQNYLSFTVEDEGAGIAPPLQQSVFKRFTSYAYENGHKTGIGLGLSVVKSFVELHQGHVLVENGKSGGAKLICRFPFHDNAIQPHKDDTESLTATAIANHSADTTEQKNNFPIKT